MIEYNKNLISYKNEVKLAENIYRHLLDFPRNYDIDVIHNTLPSLNIRYFSMSLKVLLNNIYLQIC